MKNLKSKAWFYKKKVRDLFVAHNKYGGALLEELYMKFNVASCPSDLKILYEREFAGVELYMSATELLSLAEFDTAIFMLTHWCFLDLFLCMRFHRDFNAECT